MLPRRIAGRYAEALFDLALQQNTVAEWEQELRTLADVIQAKDEFRAVLTHPEIPLKNKEAVVSRAFQGKVMPEVLAVLFMLIKRGHEPDMQTVHEIFVDRWNEARKLLPVTVTSAVPLNEGQMQALTSALTRRTGATISLTQSIDPNIIAGLVVTMGDRVIDASARTTFDELRSAMTGR